MRRHGYSHEQADENTSHQFSGNSTGYLSAIVSTSSWHWKVVYDVLGPEPQNVHLTGVETESAGPHPFFNVDQAAQQKELLTKLMLVLGHMLLQICVNYYMEEHCW